MVFQPSYSWETTSRSSITTINTEIQKALHGKRITLSSRILTVGKTSWQTSTTTKGVTKRFSICYPLTGKSPSRIFGNKAKGYS